MKTICLFFMLLIVPGVHTISQKRFNQKMIESELPLLNQRIIRLARKAPSKLHLVDSQIYHIFQLGLDGQFGKSDFSSNRFINSLYGTYYTQKRFFNTKNYLHAKSLICDGKGKLIATSNGMQVFPTNIESLANKTIVELFFKKEIDYCFHINNTPGGTYFCVKGTRVFIITENYSKTEVRYHLEEYIEQYWDDFSQNNAQFSKKYMKKAIIN